ncbi:hypothetical protein GQ457_18G010330 [Hibiscus cannabinus]
MSECKQVTSSSVRDNSETLKNTSPNIEEDETQLLWQVAVATATRPISQDYPLEQKIERLLRRRRRKLVADAAIDTVDKQSILSDQDTHGNQNACNNQNALNNQNVAARDDTIQVEKHVRVRGRSIRDNMLLNLDDLKPSIITPKIQAAQFELKSVMFTMLDFIGQFGSSPHEDARQHVRAFLEVCSSFHQQGVHEDVLKLKLFPYSLRDRSRMWLNSASPGSLQSWADLCQSFLLRYNPPNMNAIFRNKISSFRQEDDESMYEAWGRYKEIFQKCPMHGFNDWMQVEIFYQGMYTPTRMMLDAAANGTILDKSAEEAFEILERLASNDYQYPSNRRELVRQNTEIMAHDQTNAMEAQLVELTSIVKTLQKSKETNEVKVAKSFCDLCYNNHDFSECPQNPDCMFYVGDRNWKNNPYSIKYNPEGSQPPNFSWNNQRNPNYTIRQNAEASRFQQNIPQQQQSSTSSLEYSLNDFIHKTEYYMAETSKFMGRTDSFINMTEIRMQSQEATLKSLETQVGQFAQMLSARPQGNLSINTEVARGPSHEQCKVISHRNEADTYIETVPSKEAQVNKDELPFDATTSPNVVASPAKSTKFDKVCKSEEIRLPPPFPQRLRKKKNEYQFKKYLDILKQVHINMPLVEVIEQMPNFAKFLKDIVCKRKKVNEFETVALTEKCVAILENRLSPKLNDSSSLTIPCSIGNHYVGKALCDLGEDINLMPKSVFQRLCIGKAKPTTVTLQLANGSYVQPEGKIDDILVKLDKFIFPIDFIILDCETDKLAPIILGEPFLTMARTLIDVEREQLTMRANDQQVTLNAFKTLKSVDDLEECQFIRTCSNLIDSKDQSRRSTYAMDNMPKHLIPRDTGIPTLEVNKQCNKNFLMCEETLESLDQEHVEVKECPNEFNQRNATATVEDHEQRNATTTLCEAERSNASTKSEESENATTMLMLEHESFNRSYPQLSQQSHDYILHQQDDDVLIMEYDEVMVKPFEFFKKLPLSLQVFLEEPTFSKPSKAGYDCLGEDTSFMVIPHGISVAQESPLMEMIAKSRENYELKIEDFKIDSCSFNLHRIVAEDCYSNWLEQQLLRQRRLHPTMMEVNEIEKDTSTMITHEGFVVIPLTRLFLGRIVTRWRTCHGKITCCDNCPDPRRTLESTSEMIRAV